MKKKGTTRRQFLKTAGSLGVLAFAHPLITGCGGRSEGISPDYSRTISEMTAYIEQQMAKYEVTGTAIALVDDQRVVWAKGFGYADKAAGVPVTGDTIFGIGSTSKTFTAAMIMQLVDQGLVNLDDPLTKYIPRFSLQAPLAPYASAGGPITVRTMLTQHSGIPGDMLGYGVFTSVFHPEFNSRMVDCLQGEYAQFPTDFFFAYSNTAVALLADVIAAASGRSFVDYSNAFLRLLGMNHSSFNRDDPAVATGQTKTYGKGYELFDGYIPPLAAGSILSSASEMTKYIKMMHAGGLAEGSRVLRPETFEAMVTPQNTAVPLDFDFRIGFIWWLVEPDLAYAGRLCQHGGDTTLSHTACKILRDQKLGVVVLTNTLTGSSIKEQIAIKTLQLALEEKTGLRPTTFTPEYSPMVSGSADQLDAATGIYLPVLPAEALYSGALPGMQYDRIDRSGDGLTWTQDAGSSSPVTQALVLRANGRFSASDSQETEYEFRTVSGRKVMVAYHNGFRRLNADRYDPVAIPAAWASRVGTYAIVNMDPDYLIRSYPGYSERDSDVTLSIKDGLLRLGTLLLAPVSNTKAYKPGLARNLGTAVQIVNVNGEEQLEFGGYRYRKA